MSVHNEPSVAFGPEVIIEAFRPILEAEIAELKPLLPRIPRQATYQTFSMASGQIMQLTGFDASRQTLMVSCLSYDAVAIGMDRSAVETAAVGTASGVDQVTGPYFVLPGSGAVLQLHNQAPLWAKNVTSSVAVVSIIIESHSIS